MAAANAVQREAAAADHTETAAELTEVVTAEPTIEAVATESSLEQQMAAELALPQQQVVAETVAAEPEEDLAAQPPLSFPLKLPSQLQRLPQRQQRPAAR